MTPTESLYYAVGELAYAIAMTDGNIQKQERQKFAHLVAAGLQGEKYGFEISSIIFHIMDKENRKAADVYETAIKEIQLNSHYLSPEIKSTFIRVLEEVAQAFPPVTRAEGELIKKFCKEIESLHGDPIYYDAATHKLDKKRLRLSKD